MLNKQGPISPDEVGEYQHRTFPQEVFDAFNELISANFDGRSANVLQEEAANLIAAKLDIEKRVVYNKGYLNIEPAYRAAGWKVEYDKPAYCESYDANFTFRKK